MREGRFTIDNFTIEDRWEEALSIMIGGGSSMQDRQQHQQEVQAFLQKHFRGGSWEFSLPIGTGHETYFARSDEASCFV